MDTNLYETIKWYYEYTKYLNNRKEKEKEGFYPWLHTHTKYIKDYDELIKIRNMFILNDAESMPNEPILEEKIESREKIEEIMSKEGFIFVK